MPAREVTPPTENTPPTAFASIDDVLLRFQADLPVLVKDKKGQVGSQKTKYADLVQANEQILPRLNAMGCIWVCEPDLFTVPGDRGETRFVLRWSLTHVPSNTSRSGMFPILGDSPMKHGAAISYSRRYALLAVTGVVAEDEDDDAQSFEEGHAVARRRASGQARAAARPAAEGSAQVDPPRRSGRRDGAPPLPGEEGPVAERDRQVDAAAGARKAGTPPPTGEHDPGSVNQKDHRHMQALFGELGYGGPSEKARNARLKVTANLIGRESIDSSSQLSHDQAQTIIGKLTARRDALKAKGELPGQKAAGERLLDGEE